ncbi:hypothetical protein Taro_041359 [Colocasia esculenta]|uniref:Uncharacterized protein n=1 Tax=Colocasia esculenta TaxID=4460 RepID=A0A843WT98_COLES|nr:hypothetical protein [Colocasia esculenta]
MVPHKYRDKPRANSLAHREPGAPNWRGNHSRRLLPDTHTETTCAPHKPRETSRKPRVLTANY